MVAAAPALAGWRSSSRSLRAFQCWLTVYRRIWRSSIWSSVLGPLFYLGAMGLGLGTLVDKHGTASLGGVSYLDFVAPAILATSVMNTAMGEASYPVFGSVKWNKIYIAAQASPLRPADIFRGHLLFMTMRIAMNAALVTVYMWAFGASRSAWVVLAWPAATLTGLPGWLRPLAYATPLWHGVDLCRMLSLGNIDATRVLVHLAYLAALSALGIWAGARTYRGRLYV